MTANAFSLVQLSDPHLGARLAGPDPAARLAAAVEAVRARPDRPAAVLVTGDIAHSGSPEEYAVARELLDPLGAPVYPLPGNHDDRAALRSAFDLEGDGDARVDYVVELGPLRLVVVDTTLPGEDRGEVGAGLAWLDETLAASGDRPTIVALHHPPIMLGIPVWDEIGLGDGDALAAVIERHPQVQAVVGGHIHRTIAAAFGGRVVLSVPSTYLQGRVELGVEEIELVDETPGYAVHTFAKGRLMSRVEPVERAP